MIISLLLIVIVGLVIFLIKQKKDFVNVAVIDLSILLDGRIYDVINTKFLKFDLIIPSFVVDELKNIAKSSNHIERSNANRSLAILGMLKKLDSLNVNVLKVNLNNKRDNVSEVINIAKSNKAQILTKDFEIYKRASLEKIPALNFNELEASLYPIFVPGQEVYVNLVKEGTQNNQALGYFDERTTIVVQDGKGYIGKNVQVIITSSTLTPNGKLIFGKIHKEIK
ncbi:MAG: hypothetical protein LBF23_00400 [Endomicrobium sp.]|jgi:uncharacterized protein YacL|nr:hypothetical protein [Endomicrobium sp.]